jgi:hypothetical protein
VDHERHGLFEPGDGPGRRAVVTADAGGGPPPGRRRRVAIGIVVALTAAGAVAAAAASAFSGSGSPATGGNVYHTGTATVTRQSLTEQTQQDAMLGDAGSYSVVNQAQGPSGGSGGGTYTSLPRVGAVVRQGQVLYAVSGSPVVLLYGSTPAYRDLAEGDTGPDVTELNTGLIRLGYVTVAGLGPRPGWDYYSAETAYGVELLQARVGVTETGSLDLGAAVFVPGAIEVTGYGTGTVLGGPAPAGSVVLTASSTTPVVTIDLDASLQSEVHAGEPAGITLPDGSTTPGVVWSVSNVATSSSSSGSPSSDQGSSSSGATITVLVSLDDPKAAGSLNQAPVEVTITTGSVSDALVVPVDALLAQSNGGYDVEVIGGHGHYLVPVTLGVFDDAAGLVQVIGPRLAAGQKVVVPAV